jgi:phosphatidylserine decarboxylase
MLESLLGILLALLVLALLAWKWRLGLARVLLGGTLLGLLAALLTAPLRAMPLARGAPGVVLVAGLTMLLAVAVLAYRFYRDPERVSPTGRDLIVSPADGEVLYVRESQGGRLPVSTKWGNDYPLMELTKTSLRTDEAIVVGIGMSFLDVHVNRAPLDGTVTIQRHFPGRFGSLGRPEMVFENERATTVIVRDELEIAVVQIASRLVRQIATFVREGQTVQLGQRIGVIRLGSQVDLVLPARSDLTIAVKPRDRLTAGVSVVARLTAAVPATPTDATPVVAGER